MRTLSIKAAGLLLAALLSFCPSGLLKAQEDEVGRLPSASWSSPKYMVLCYHDIPMRLSEDRYGVDVTSFVAQLEYMRDAGCHFIGVDDIENAAKGERPLPGKAVLLTFDDAYESFYKNVLPLLRLYKIPAILAVVPHWVDEVPSETEYKKGIMTRGQLKELSESGLVELAGHSFNSHKELQINPQGGTGPAIANRAFDPKAGGYETEEAYARRIQEDMRSCASFLKDLTGKSPRVLMWPYGRYSGIAIKAAQAEGFSYLFTLDDGLADVADSSKIPRHMLEENPTLLQFIEGFKRLFALSGKERVAQASLDLIFDKDPEVQARNIDRFLDRMVLLRPSSVYLQAFSGGAPGEGANIKELYFPNSHMAMKADLLSRVARSLGVRGIQVYACMPLFRLEGKDGRLIEPLSPDGSAKLSTLYRELASACMLDGLVFQDDGFLSAPAEGSEDALLALTAELKRSVFEYRPAAVFARTLYANASSDKSVQERFDRGLSKYLEAYDFAVLLCCPEQEGLLFRERWLKSLVAKVKAHPQGLRKTVFNIQAYDWKDKEWIGSETLVSWLRAAIAEGAFSAGYFPDDFKSAKPGLKELRSIISYEDFPFNK